MSRAFVKEDSNAPEPMLERPVSAAPNRVTERGLELIEAELARIESLLPPPPTDGAPEPAELQALRRDARYWAQRRATAQVEAAPEAPATVGFATRVTVRRDGGEQILDIVGEDEADPALGRIAWTAPLTQALDQAEVGDEIEFEAGGRIQAMTVLAIAPLGSTRA